MIGNYQDDAINRRNAAAVQASIDRIARLEAERFSTSYLRHAPQKPNWQKLTPGEKRLIDEDLMARGREARQKRKNAKKVSAETLWHAGRYAAGARDEEAIEANLKYRQARGLK